MPIFVAGALAAYMRLDGSDYATMMLHHHQRARAMPPSSLGCKLIRLLSLFARGIVPRFASFAEHASAISRVHAPGAAAIATAFLSRFKRCRRQPARLYAMRACRHVPRFPRREVTAAFTVSIAAAHFSYFMVSAAPIGGFARVRRPPPG